MNTRIIQFLLGVVLVVAAGCSTPQSRAQEHADLFSTFTPEVRARLEAGQPAVGDTKDMVYIALGEPDTIMTRSDQSGLVYEIWSYDGVYYTRDTRWHSTSMFRRYRHHGYDYYSGPDYIDVQHEYERLRIEFEGGKVKAIDQVQR